MKKSILLYSRYGGQYKLNRIGGKDSHLYSFSGDSGHTRVGIDDCRNGHYTFIDPPGGPFLSVGSSVDGYIIEDIWLDNEGIVLRLKE